MANVATTSGLFGDPSQWVVRRGVPVFVEHDEVWEDADGVQHVDKFGQKELEEIAKDSNRREIETGDATPILIGHIPRDKTGKVWHYERDLGDLVGYCRNYHVGRFGPEKKLAVLSDHWFRKKEYAKAMEFPRRSVELWDKRIIDPVCLLKRTPQLDLGLLTSDSQPETCSTYARSVGGMLTYQRGTNCRIYQMEEPPVDDAVKQQLIDLLGQMQALLTGTGGEPDANAAGLPAAGVPPTAAAPAMYSKEDFEKLKAEQKKLQKEVEKAQKDANDNRQLYQRTERKVTREKALAKVKEDNSLTFDVDDELEDVLDYDDARFEKHLEKIPKKYARDEEQMIRVEPSVRRAPKQGGDKDKAEKARDYALKNGCEYEDALAKV